MAPDDNRGLRELLRELRRRRVFRVAVVYAAGVFAILQAADIVVPALGLSETVVRGLVIFSLLGFPITMVVAWVYDLTPAGIIRTAPEGEASEIDPRVSAVARTLLVAITVLMVAGAGILAVRWSGEDPTVGSLDTRRVAVLPFRDMNATDSTGFFTQGLHDDIITQLSKVSALTVISRTSVMEYEGSTAPIREIAGQLQAGTILEGSVRQAGGRIRVDTRLIDAATDATIWVESYERDREDIFAIQSEIAQQIALALEAELSPEERARIAAVPTSSQAAYEAYQLGEQHFDRRDNQADALASVEYFQEAASLDPEFSQAFSALSRARMWLYWNWPGYGDQLEGAVEALARADELDPQSEETQLAHGYVLFYGQGDLTRALEHFNLARQLRPSDARSIAAIGLIQERRGAWDQAISSFGEALENDPRSFSLTLTMAEALTRMRRFDEASRYLDRAVSLQPSVMEPYIRRVLLPIAAAGDTVGARTELEAYRDRLTPQATARLEGTLAFYRGDLSGAAERLESMEPRDHRMLGLVYHAMGRLDQAETEGAALYETAEASLQSLERSGLGQQPGLQARLRSELAVAEALRGRRLRAFREGLAAVETVPLSRDAVDGADHLVSLGTALALVGEHGDAIDRLTQALDVPSGLTRSRLLLDPTFADLRMLQDFQQVADGDE
jgi:TolB-like protein/Flp pilus assembly protein TadD